jgi:hypothetical protein
MSWRSIAANVTLLYHLVLSAASYQIGEDADAITDSLRSELSNNRGNSQKFH